jgi:hypothetical protein
VVTTAKSRVLRRLRFSQLSDITYAADPSTTSDFSCVSSNAGLLSLTATPAASSA